MGGQFYKRNNDIENIRKNGKNKSIKPALAVDERIENKCLAWSREIASARSGGQDRGRETLVCKWENRLATSSELSDNVAGSMFTLKGAADPDRAST